MACQREQSSLGGFHNLPTYMAIMARVMAKTTFQLAIVSYVVSGGCGFWSVHYQKLLMFNHHCSGVMQSVPQAL